MTIALRNFLGECPIFHMISGMYKDNICYLVIRGEVFKGFNILCGVGQGCPLAGSLFVFNFPPIVVSLSNALHRAAMNLGHGIFAYADDLALVLCEFWRLLPFLHLALAVVASAAGLRINWQSVQLVPLWCSLDLAIMRRRLSATCPSLASAKIAISAKYLGIMVGPGDTDQSKVAAPLGKYIQRCRFIAKIGPGWVCAASCWHPFHLSDVPPGLQVLRAPPRARM
jgi:hypothetical protein